MKKHSFCLSPAFKICRLAAVVEKQADQVLQDEIDITFSQFMILHSLQHNPDCSQRCIAQCRDLTQAAVSRQINALRAKKLLHRRANDQNRREHILHMTDRGKNALALGLECVEQTVEALFGALPKKDLLCLEQGVDTLLHSFRQKKEGQCIC